MLRPLEKKNWRKNIEACWNVSNQLQNCVNNSEIYKTLDKKSQSIIQDSIGKNFISSYLSNWVDGTGFSAKQKEFYSSDSSFWNNESLTQLKEECSLNSLNECCQEKYNLNNLEGDYEYIGQTLKKN